MKITMVMASDQNGGLEKHVRELSRQLVVLGYEVAVIAPDVFLKTLSETVQALPIPANLSRHNPIALYQLWRQLKKANGDVIHAQANKAAYMVGKLKPWLTVPLVATLHNVKTHVKAFKAFKHVITVSGQLKQAFDASTHVHVIYNGIQTPATQPMDLHQQFDLPARPVICAVGRLVDAKGFDLLLKAVDGLPVNVLIVGEGPNRAALTAQISQLSAQTHVKLVGHRQDVADMMAASDALVIASRREGFSYVFVEALHCQCRILSTSVPDVDAALPPALIVPTESVLALRDRLTALLADMPAWTALMQPAWQFAALSLTCEAMAKQTANVYAVLEK